MVSSQLRILRTPGARQLQLRCQHTLAVSALGAWLHATKAKQFERRKVLTRSLQQWGSWLRCSRMARRRGQVASAGTLVPDVLRIWKHAAHESVKSRTLQQTAHSGPGRRLRQRAALHAWKSETVRRVAGRTVVKLVARAKRRAALQAWHSAWSLKVRLQHAQAQGRQGALQGALTVWRAWAAKRVATHAAGQQLAHQCSKQRAAVVLAAWRAEAHFESRVRAVSSVLQSIRCKFRLGTWRDRSLQRQVARGVAAQIAASQQASMARKALSGWKRVWQARVAHREVIGTLRKRRCVQVWRKRTEHSQRRRALMQRCAHVLAVAKARSALNRWRGYVERRSDERQRLRQAHYTSWRWRVRLAVMHWRGVAHRTWALQRPAAIHARSSALRRALRNWREYAVRSLGDREQQQAAAGRMRQFRATQAVTKWARTAQALKATRIACDELQTLRLARVMKAFVHQWQQVAAASVRERAAVLYFGAQFGRRGAANPALDVSFTSSALPAGAVLCGSSGSDTTHTGTVRHRQSMLQVDAKHVLATRAQQDSMTYGGYASDGTVDLDADSVAHSGLHESGAQRMQGGDSLSARSMLRDIHNARQPHSLQAAPGPAPRRTVGTLAKLFKHWRTAARRGQRLRAAAIAVTATRIVRSVRRAGVAWRAALRRKALLKTAFNALWAGTVGVAPRESLDPSHPSGNSTGWRASISCLQRRCQTYRLRHAFGLLKAAAKERQRAQAVHMQRTYRVCTELRHKRQSAAQAAALALRPALRRAVRTWATETARRIALRDVQTPSKQYGWVSLSRGVRGGVSSTSSPRDDSEQAAHEWSQHAAAVLSPASWLTPPSVQPAGASRAGGAQICSTPPPPTAESWLPSWEEAAVPAAHTPGARSATLSFDLTPSPAAPGAQRGGGTSVQGESPPLPESAAAARSLWLGGLHGTHEQPDKAAEILSGASSDAPYAQAHHVASAAASPASPQGLLKQWMAATSKLQEKYN